MKPSVQSRRGNASIDVDARFFDSCCHCPARKFPTVSTFVCDLVAQQFEPWNELVGRSAFYCLRLIPVG